MICHLHFSPKNSKQFGTPQVIPISECLRLTSFAFFLTQTCEFQHILLAFILFCAPMLITSPKLGSKHNLIHNLSFQSPNGECKFICNIFIWRPFRWFKYSLIETRFSIWTFVTKIWDTHKTPIPKVEIHLKVLGFIPLHFLTLVRTCLSPMMCFLNSLAFSCLSFDCEPKVRVMTLEQNWNSSHCDQHVSHSNI